MSNKMKRQRNNKFTGTNRVRKPAKKIEASEDLEQLRKLLGVNFDETSNVGTYDAYANWFLMRELYAQFQQGTSDDPLADIKATIAMLQDSRNRSESEILVDEITWRNRADLEQIEGDAPVVFPNDQFLQSIYARAVEKARYQRKWREVAAQSKRVEFNFERYLVPEGMMSIPPIFQENVDEVEANNAQALRLMEETIKDLPAIPPIYLKQLLEAQATGSVTPFPPGRTFAERAAKGPFGYNLPTMQMPMPETSLYVGRAIVQDGQVVGFQSPPESSNEPPKKIELFRKTTLAEIEERTDGWMNASIILDACQLAQYGVEEDTPCYDMYGLIIFSYVKDGQKILASFSQTQGLSADGCAFDVYEHTVVVEPGYERTHYSYRRTEAQADKLLNQIFAAIAPEPIEL